MTPGLPWHLIPAVGERVALEMVAALGAALAALVVLRFFLAPIFLAGTLTVPACRHCRAGLRGDGEAMPRRCPECGKALDPAVDVRWMAHARPIGWRVAVLGLALVLGITVGGVVAVKLAEDWIRTSPRSTAAASDLVLERMLAFPSLSPSLPDRLDLIPTLRARYFGPLLLVPTSALGGPSPNGGALAMAINRAEAIAAARAGGEAIDPRDEEWARRLALTVGGEQNRPFGQRVVDVIRTVHTPVLSMKERVVRGRDAIVFHDALIEGQAGLAVVEVLTECRWAGATETLAVRRLSDIASLVAIPASTPRGLHVMEIRWRSHLQTSPVETGVILSEHLERVPVVVVDQALDRGEDLPPGITVPAAKSPLEGALAIVDIAKERAAVVDVGNGEPRLLLSVELLIRRRPFVGRLRSAGSWRLVVGDVEVPLRTKREGGGFGVVQGPTLRGFGEALVLPKRPTGDVDVGVGAGDHLVWHVALPLKSESDRRVAEILQSRRAALRFVESGQLPRAPIDVAAVPDVPVTVRTMTEVPPAGWYLEGAHEGWPTPPRSDVEPNRYAKPLTWLLGW